MDFDGEALPMDFETGYHQPTVFDRLWCTAQRNWRRQASRRGPALWGAGFLFVAVLFHAIGALFLYSAIFPNEAAALPGLVSALLAFGVARHFTLSGLPLLKELSGRLSALGLDAHRAADHAVLAVAALVVLPLTLYAAQAAHPVAAVLLLVCYGLAGRQLWRQMRQAVTTPSQDTPSRAEEAAAVLVPVVAPPPETSPRERREYLASLRAAGVNVRIARALVSAGFGEPRAVSRARDEEILAVRGVGPATLRKIRVRFPSA